MHIELYTGTQDECKSPLSTTSGLNIYIHNHTYTLTEEDNAISAQPGFETNIEIDRTYVKKLSEPYSDCMQPCENSECLKKSDLIEETKSVMFT